MVVGNFGERNGTMFGVGKDENDNGCWQDFSNNGNGNKNELFPWTLSPFVVSLKSSTKLLTRKFETFVAIKKNANVLNWKIMILLICKVYVGHDKLLFFVMLTIYMYFEI